MCNGAVPELTVVVPSRGRPDSAPELCGAFARTCTADTELIFAVDGDDPTLDGYHAALRGAASAARGRATPPYLVVVPRRDGTRPTMVAALNAVAGHVARRAEAPAAVGFMNDDHEPLTAGWDEIMLAALAARPGVVYGDDMVMGEAIPTAWVMSTVVLRALPHMVPEGLWHLYADDYVRDLARAAGCLAYLPHVKIRHNTPLVGRRPADEGYLRVNAGEVYDHDKAELARYRARRGEADVAAVRAALAGAGAR